LSRRTRLDLAVGALTVAAYLAVQLALLLGPHPNDPAKYFSTAVGFPDVPADLWTLRIGLVIPMRLAVLLMGPTEVALYAVPLAAGVLLVAAVFGLVLAVFRDRAAAAAAALVTALNTDYLLNASSPFPDTLATTTFATGFLLLVLAGLAPADASVRLVQVCVVIAGFLFGWTYLTREFSPILLPTLIAAVLILRLPLRRVALLAGAAVGTAALELVYGLAAYGDPLVHLHELAEHRRAGLSGAGLATPQNQVDGPLDSIAVFPRLLMSWGTGWLMLVLVVLLAATLLLLRDRRLWLFAAWFFGFWAMMAVIGLLSLPSGRWLVNVGNVRYWSPIFPALAIGAFGGLSLLLRRHVPRRRLAITGAVAALALATVILVPGIVEFRRCASRHVWRNEPIERWHELRDWLSTRQAKGYGVIVTDNISARLLDPAFVHEPLDGLVWDGSVVAWKRDPDPLAPVADRSRSLVLVSEAGYASAADGRAVVAKLTPSWAPVFTSGDGGLVVFSHQPVGGTPASVRPKPWWEESKPARRLSGCGGHGTSEDVSGG
jgi:hypothetical protein